MATGLVVDQAVDIELDGLIPFELKRFYSSGRNKDVRATLGPGWAHNWEMSVWEEASVTVLRDSEGRSVFFDQIPVGGTSFHRGERMELKRLAADRWEIFELKTRRTLRFEAFEDGGQAALREVRDAWNNRIDLVYEDGRLGSIVDTAGRQIELTWEGARIRRVAVRAGSSVEQSVDYFYSDAGCLSAVTDAVGHTETFEYDGQRRMVATTLKTDVTFRYEYEADTGRCSRTWGPKGLYDLTFTADLANHKTFADGEEPRVYTVDDAGHVTREALPSGAVLVERAYDQDGFLIAEVNGAGEGTKYWYDARGNLVRAVDAEGGVTAWEYDQRDLPTKRTFPDGRVTAYAQDDKGATTRITYPTGLWLAMTYDSRGRLVRVDSPEGIERLYEYDEQHTLLAETDVHGARTTYGHDGLGRVVAKTDPLGRVYRAVRDGLGRVSALMLPGGATLRRTYDGRGNVVREVDGTGRVTTRQYVGMGKVSQVTEPDGRTWRFRYTSNERLAEVTNPRGERYAFVYDEAGRVVRETTFDGREIAYGRDASGRVTTMRHPDGTAMSYTYDRAGRLRAEEGSDGVNVRYRRDRLGRMIAAVLEDKGRVHETIFERDPHGRLIAERSGDRVTRYDFDTFGRLLARVLPNGTRTAYAYDKKHRLTSVEHAGERFDIARDACGNEASITPAERRFALLFGRDPLDRLIDQRVAPRRQDGSFGSAVQARQAKFDFDGRPESVTDERWGIDTFDYDPLGRLTSWRGAAEKQTFRYDEADGLIGRFEAASKESKPWKVAGGSLLVETPSAKMAYDKRGRRVGVRDLTVTEGAERVTEYRWDSRDRLREVKKPDGTLIRYAYDALDRRIRKEVHTDSSGRPSSVVDFVWSGDVVVAELSEGGAARTFVHRPMTFEPLLHEERGEVFLCANDHLGTVRELIDKQGGVAWARRADPWGATVAEYTDPLRERAGRSVSSPFRLVGQYADEDTGLALTRYRAFDASTARWLSPDPFGLATSRNLFAFDGCPTYVIDPLGLTGDPHTVHHESEAAARRAALREAGIPTSDPSRQVVTEVPSQPGSQAPTGPRGMRTEIRDSANPNGPTVHHDPYGHRFEDNDGNVQTIPPHWGVDRPGGGTTHHTYPSDHDPMTNR
jgi:RHS repeat-associated protein